MKPASKICLSPIQDEFDFIFIDCPPSLGLLTINALTAADSVLIPIQCEYYALEGVTKLLESMKMVKSRLNKGLDTYGVLMTMYDSRTSLSNQVVEEVQSYFGDKAFKTLIPRTVKISEAPSFGEPVITYATSKQGCKSVYEPCKRGDQACLVQRNVVDWDADSMLWSQRLSMRPVVLLHLLQMPHLKQNYY